MKTCIVVKFDVEGVHCWPEAPEHYEVLRDPHGHIFRFEVHLPVDGSRQVEFLWLRRLLVRTMKKGFGEEPCNFKSYSCEDLALWLLNGLSGKFDMVGGRIVVMEDEFVGAEVAVDEPSESKEATSKRQSAGKVD